jgi:CubicO group peptidase (beta-lactamase class C family)
MHLEGTVEPGFDSVADAFAEVLAGASGNGAAVAAWHNGAWLVDLWGGWSDVVAEHSWNRDSIVQPFSVTKPFAALCLLRLVDRGAVDLDAPMQRYWPEFRAPASVRQVLSHQAGVVAIDEPAPTSTFYDWPQLCALLARQEPQWAPGAEHGESALFYGHLVGEVVRRVDDRSLGRFLGEEICGPLGLDFAIGLTPEDLGRAVDLSGIDDGFRARNLAGKPELYGRAISNPPGALDPAVINGAQWRAAEIPAVNGHGTARGIAGLYAALMRGDVISSALLAEATTVHSAGTDLVFGHDNAWGLGFAVDGDGFGLGGLGGSYGGASRSGDYAFGFVTASVGDGAAGLLVENALRSALGLAPIQ